MNQPRELPPTESPTLRIAKVLGDPQRFALLERIAAQPEVACKQLVQEFPITQATISHHLKELEAVGLICIRRAGQCSYLSAHRAILRGYLGDLAERLLPGDGLAPAHEKPSGPEGPEGTAGSL